MSKKVAVLAVNPVNGSGLFQYLEAFYENGIPYDVFAVSDKRSIGTNSGLNLDTGDVIANLKGNSDKYDALVFACGDAMPVFAENADEQYNKDLMDVIKEFGNKGKIMIGHCVAGMLYDMAEVANGTKIALHPLAQPAISNAIATDEDSISDGNFHTAKTERTINNMIDDVVRALS